MTDTERFEIPSAILAAAVVAKSDLTGHELSIYAINLQRNYVKMMARRETEAEAD